MPAGLLEGDVLGRIRCGGGEVGVLFRGSKGCGTDMRAASNLLTGREEEGTAGGAADETLFAADPTTPGESRRRGEPFKASAATLEPPLPTTQGRVGIVKAFATCQANDYAAFGTQEAPSVGRATFWKTTG